jgi:predicted NBD/HSP70 family sugar kinase
MKIGVDWGGTKIEAVLIDPQNGTEVNRVRVDSPQGDYEEILL